MSETGAIWLYVFGLATGWAGGSILGPLLAHQFRRATRRRR